MWSLLARMGNRYEASSLSESERAPAQGRLETGPRAKRTLLSALNSCGNSLLANINAVNTMDHFSSHGESFV